MNAWQWLRMRLGLPIVVRKGAVIDVKPLAGGLAFYVPHDGYNAWSMMEALKKLAGNTCKDAYTCSVIETSQRHSWPINPYVIPSGVPFHFTYVITLYDEACNCAVRTELPHNHTTPTVAFLGMARQKILLAMLTLKAETEGEALPSPE